MVKDIFSYSARWDSIGLDCCECVHFQMPGQRIGNSFCSLHRLSFAITVGRDGYKDGEWFCKQYEDAGKTWPQSLIEFNALQPFLENNILYQAYCNEVLLETPFEKMGK